MTSFDQAYAWTIGKIEGGYSDNPNDAGGETYKGISRVYWPGWPGWRIVDEIKRTTLRKDYDIILGQNEELQQMTKAFYKQMFWDIFQGDALPVPLSLEMFDQSINMGQKEACTSLQRCLNVMNRRGSLYPDLVVDGKIGKKTVDAVYAYLRTDSLDDLILLLNHRQGEYYFLSAEKREMNEDFIRGWLKRTRK